MGLSNQARTAVAAGLLALSAHAATANSPSASSHATTRPTSTISLIRPSAVAENAMASSSTVPVMANSKVPLVLAVVPARDPISRRDGENKHSKRGPLTRGFVGASPADPYNCADATTYDLTDGSISSDGVYFTPGRDVSYEPFHPSSRGDSSAPGKFVVEDGRLRWYDNGFYGGRARYCQMPGSGQVYVTFRIDSTWPAGCREVDLAAEPQASCKSGKQVVPKGDGHWKGGRKGDKDGKKHKHKGGDKYDSDDEHDSDSDHDYDSDDDDDHHHKKGKGKKDKDDDKDKDKSDDDSDHDSDSDHSDSDSDDDDDEHYRTEYPTTTTRYSTHTSYKSSSSYYSQASSSSYKTNDGYKSSPHQSSPPYPTASTYTPTSQGIYPTTASPTDQYCVETHLSWVQGSHTFIKDEL
ncbi:hypothetical protein K445DRAFT_26653 [Daldinia sp. EC12]|nr:hypothetical protein K445DRAFT_26653 [Daldinia sp. EC12]